MNFNLRHLAALAALAAIWPASQAHAISISIDSIIKLGSNTATGIYGPSSQRQSSYDSAVSVLNPGTSDLDVVGNTVTASTRYASTQTSDGDGLFQGAASLAATASYEVKFTVTPGINTIYDLVIDTSRIGAFVIRDETGATAANSLGAVSGTLDGPANGGLALAALPGLSNSSTQVSAFNQTNSTLLSGLSGGPQQFTLTFTWSGNTSSNSGINGGDESAILMGLDTNINGDVAAADDYPGTSGRVEANDGHFVFISAEVVQVVPEPTTWAMALTAVVGFATVAFRRRKRNS
jgi:hypothetical protein